MSENEAVRQDEKDDGERYVIRVYTKTDDRYVRNLDTANRDKIERSLRDAMEHGVTPVEWTDDAGTGHVVAARAVLGFDVMVEAPQ